MVFQIRASQFFRTLNKKEDEKEEEKTKPRDKLGVMRSLEYIFMKPRYLELAFHSNSLVA